MTKFAKVFASFVKKLCREWTCTNACGISFHNAEDIFQIVRAYTRTCGSTTSDWMRGCYEWICTMIKVEHSCLRAFEQYLFVLLNRFQYSDICICYIRFQSLCIFSVIRKDFIIINRFSIVYLSKHFIFKLNIVRQFLFERFHIVQIADTNANTVDFISVARTDTVFSCTDFSITFGCFFGHIKSDMVWHDDMSAVRNVKGFCGFTLFFKTFDFL